MHSFIFVIHLVYVISSLQYIALERKLLKWKAPGTWIERKTGISPADRNVLFRGIGLRMARSGIASFILAGSYYLVVDYIS